MAQRVNIEVLNKAAVDVTVQNSNAINVEVPTAPRGLSAPFTANKTEIDEGAVVDFTATNPGFQYLFSIEDVGRFVNKIGKNVRHQFLDSGSFDVALTQADLDQQASGIQVKRDFIKVNEVEFLLNKPFATGATAAYSLRKLERSVTKAVRVREDSGNTEADIGFSGGTLDTTALLNHVGSNNGFVTKWYDQSGNGNDASNSTASEQPQIVDFTNFPNKGVIQENGRPAIQFTRNNSTGLDASEPSYDHNQIQVFSVHKLELNEFCSVFSNDNNRNGSNSAFVIRALRNGNLANDLIDFANIDKNIKATSQFLNSQILGNFLFEGSNTGKDELNIRVDGSQDVGGYFNGSTDIDTLPTVNSELQIGSRQNGFDAFEGKIQEILFYDKNKTTSESNIETNINNHYSIF